MQDYFKYDKIQGGAPLYMKSDSDGVSDKEKGALPLGIKSVPQGLKHFTNWNDIATSIEKKNSLRFEDAQPNSLYFSMPNRKARQGALGVGGYFLSDSGKYFTTPYVDGSASSGNNLSFIDSWEANDIAILDDMAFVAYENYTDLNREDLSLGAVSMKQPFTVYTDFVYDGSIERWDNVGSLCLSSDQLPYNNLIYSKNEETGKYDDPDGAIFLSNDFASFDNCVLKIEFTGVVGGKETSGGVDDEYFQKRTLYFTYGGARNNAIFDPNELIGGYDTHFRYGDTIGSTAYDLSDFNDGDFAGQFYLVTTDQEDGFSLPRTEKKYGYNENRVVNLQIPLNFSPNRPPDYSNQLEYYLRLDDDSSTEIKTISLEANVTLMKFTPVRKCGKIDIYTKKTGTIAVHDGYRFASLNHGLKTNDIIRISSAAFENENDATADTHPLNGDKFVKVQNESIFYLYEDQFFKKPVNTSNLKFVVFGLLREYGINWTRVGNTYGDDAQSWNYHSTIFSPTGRNGYVSKKNADVSYSSRNSLGESSTPLPENDAFITTQRNKTAAFSCSLDNVKLNKNSSYSLFLDFTEASSVYTDAAERKTLGKIVKNLEENIPVSTLGKSAFGILNKGPQDFYPYHCASDEHNVFTDINNNECSPYTGNRFGCALDVKYSHSVGNTKIYTLVVGERGADISVDLFGASSEMEHRVDGSVPYCQATSDSIYNTFRQRVIPYNLPNGKIHVINITVDRYGRITDISHKNTLSGDGSSINSAAGIETHPWEDWIDNVYGFKWRYKQYINGDLKYLIYSPFIFNTFQFDYGNQPNALPMSITYNTAEAPFGEKMIARSSLYWDRAAVTNWAMVDVYDYFSNQYGRWKLLRDLSESNRKIAPTSGQDGENSSRFGYSGIGVSVPIYERIDRFDIANNQVGSQWYILPWVDSFGKSVALSNRQQDGTLHVFGGVTTRSNIDFENINDLELYLRSSTPFLKRPLFSSSSLNNYTIENNKTKTQIGQISCITLDSDYKCSKFKEINSGGSVDSSRVPDTNQTNLIKGDLPYSPYINVLRDSHEAGTGRNDASISCYWSINKILYKDGYLFWADQRLKDKKATINVLSHESDNSFLPKSTIDRNFIQRIGTYFSVEGFGLDLRFDDGLLVTNSLTNLNDFGQILSSSSVTSGVYDVMLLYSFSKEKLNFIQQISPSFSKSDDRYSDKLIKEYENALISINNISYDNTSVNSLTWNIRLLGKYDVIGDKILLKDPIEYVLFGRDYSYDKILSDNAVSSSYTSEIDPYFYYTEIFDKDTIYYDYSNKDSFIVEDGSYWKKSPENQLSQDLSRTRTPVFFFSLPEISNGYYGDLNIVIDKPQFGSGRFLAATTDLDSGESIARSIGYSSLLPKLVLYKKDPRSMIVPNGPSVSGDNNTITPYEDGMYTYDSDKLIPLINKNQYDILTPCIAPLFRGGAHDMFYYGSRPDSVVGVMPEETLGDDYEYYNFLTQNYGGSFNLGELFDLTYNQSGNVNKGIISWIAPDMYYYDTRFSDISPHAILNSSFTTVGEGKYLITIPHAIWKDYVVDGNLLKGSEQNRPFFGSFTRIKHGSLTSPNNDSFNPIVGNWDYTYDDTNRSSYVGDNLYSNKTLIIGLACVGVTDVDISSNSIQKDSTVISNYLRSMSEHKVDKRNRYTSKYSYAPVISTTSTSDPTLNFATRKEIITFYSSSEINNIDVSINVTSFPKRQFNTKFSRIAYYEYNKAAYTEVQKNIIDLATSNVDRYAFGKYSFTPLPIGLSEEFNDSTEKIGASRNPIIRVGKSVANSDSQYAVDGSFVKTNQVLTSDSIRPFGFESSIKTEYYVDDAGDKIYYELESNGNSLGFAHFSSQNLIGGFDIDDQEYLSLHIASIPEKKSKVNLYTKSLFASGDATLYSSGITAINSDMSLWTGFGVDDDEIPLYLKSVDLENYTSLFIEEVKPSGDIPIYVSGPSSSGILPLTFSPPGTGDIPLSISGPSSSIDDAALNVFGKSFFTGRETLHTSGIYGSGTTTTLNMYGSVFHDDSLNLMMNIPQSGNATLFIVAPYEDDKNTTLVMPNTYGVSTTNPTLFIGTQYDISAVSANLVIKDTQKYLNDNAELFVDGTVGYANSIISRRGDSNIDRSRYLIDITQDSELPVGLTFNNSTTTSNSITKRNLNSTYYNSKIKKVNTPENIYFGSQKKEQQTKNPAYLTKILDTSNNKGKAFYYDNNGFVDSELNSVIKRDAYDANGKNLAIAFCNNRLADIDIYDIIANSNLRFASKMSFGLTYQIPETSELLDINYAKNGTQQIPHGDSFIAIRRDIKEFFSSEYDNSDLQNDSDLFINDLKLSRLGQCAVSATAKIHYSNGEISDTKIFDVIIVFNISNIKNGVSNISGYTGKTTYYVEKYGYKIYERSGTGYNQHSAGYSLTFDNEDVYFDRRLGGFGQIWKLTSSSYYSQDIKVIDFADNPDSSGYSNSNNLAYISENHRRAAFGVPVKVFEDYHNPAGKIMFIGAHLFDPYVLNTLTSPHIPNAVGAVYIYKKANDDADWSYFGAMYGKGNTSNDMPYAKADYTDSSYGNERYGLFGYDFDYSQGKITISEPGGHGDDPINLPRVYLFEITNTLIYLEKTLIASDVDSPYPEPDATGDNFGSHIVMVDANNPITFAEATFSSTFDNTLAYEVSSVTTAQQAKTNLANETKFYETTQIANLNPDLITRSEDILSIRKLNFGNDKYKVGAIRNFSVRSVDPYNLDPNYNFDLQKFFILDANKNPMSLFISGPLALDDDGTSLQIAGLGVTTLESTLQTKGRDTNTGSINLMIRQSKEFGDMPLHMETVGNNYGPLYMSGDPALFNSNIGLTISTPSMDGDLGLYMKPIGGSSGVMYTNISGSEFENIVYGSPLFIGKDIRKSDDTSLYLTGAGTSTVGATLNQAFTPFSVSGRFEYGQDSYSTLYLAAPSSYEQTEHRTLYITTDIPDIGAGGGYVGSGYTAFSVEGNNNANIFTSWEKFASLYMDASIGQNTNIPLFIERPTTNVATLFIKDQNPSGISTLAISGAYMSSGNISLIMFPPTENNISIFTRGYLE